MLLVLEKLMEEYPTCHIDYDNDLFKATRVCISCIVHLGNACRGLGSQFRHNRTIAFVDNRFYWKLTITSKELACNNKLAIYIVWNPVFHESS